MITRTNDELLDALEEERQKFTQANKFTMLMLIKDLEMRRVYTSTPVMQKHGYSFLTMVESWGARWHEYKEPLNCPQCHADWRNLESGPPFKREIGISNGDSVYAWKCPDCGKVK